MKSSKCWQYALIYNSRNRWHGSPSIRDALFFLPSGREASKRSVSGLVANLHNMYILWTWGWVILWHWHYGSYHIMTHPGSAGPTRPGRTNAFSEPVTMQVVNVGKLNRHQGAASIQFNWSKFQARPCPYIQIFGIYHDTTCTTCNLCWQIYREKFILTLILSR